MKLFKDIPAEDLMKAINSVIPDSTPNEMASALIVLARTSPDKEMYDNEIINALCLAEALLSIESE